MAVVAPPLAFVDYFPIRTFVDRAEWASAGLAGGFTSWYRTVAGNRRVGGHPWSQHLVGLAADRSPASASFRSKARAAGLIAIYEGSHDHIQAWPAGTLERVYA